MKRTRISGHLASGLPVPYQWTSRLGHVYLIEIPPVIDELPDPMPEPDREPAPPAPPYGPHPDRDSNGKTWPESGSRCDNPPPATHDPEPEAKPQAPLPRELDIPPF